MRAAALRVTGMSIAALASSSVFHRHQHRGAETLWNEGRDAESGFQRLLIHERRGAGLKLTRAAALGSVPISPEQHKSHTTSKMNPKTDSQDPNMIYTEFITF